MINALRIANVLLGVRPGLIDTSFILHHFLDIYGLFAKDIYLREARGSGFNLRVDFWSSNPKHYVWI